MVDGRQYWMEQPTKALRPKPARPVVKKPSLDEVVEALVVEEFRNPEVTGRGVDRTRGLEIKHKSVGSPGLSRYDAQLTPVKKDNRFVKNLKDAAKVPSAINDAYQAVVDYQFPDMFTSPTHPDVPVGQALTGFKNLFLPMQLGDVGVDGGLGMIPIVMPSTFRGPIGNALSKLSGGKKRPNIPIKKEPKQIPTPKTADDLLEAVDKTGKGQCFPYCKRRAEEAIKSGENIKIVQGTYSMPKGARKPHEVDMPHVWVEKDNLIQDWQTMELPSGSHFAGKGIPKEMWDDPAIGPHLQEFVPHFEFTPEEWIKITDEFGELGPFTVEEISKVLGK